jgi:hypothetical protein
MAEARIPVKDSAVGASVHGSGGTVLVLGHGAGGDRRNPFLVRVAEAIAASGRGAVLYNFLYSEAGRKAPDPGAVLEDTADAVAAWARSELKARAVVLGGKSMGGRIASQAVARGTAADGLVFLGYPLHPPGKADQRRDRHLPGIACPMLFVQGTRDAFARWDLIEDVVGRLGPGSRLLRIEGGDHSFAVTTGGGRTPRQVEDEILDGIRAWLETHGL